MKNTTQLALSVQLPDDEIFDNYLSESNNAVVSQLALFLDKTDLIQVNQPRCFYLFGLTGVGKSHLLHASSAYVSQKNRTLWNTSRNN